jgi:hypothetical protein
LDFAATIVRLNCASSVRFTSRKSATIDGFFDGYLDGEQHLASALLKSCNFAKLGGAISKALARSLPITFRSVNGGFLLGEYGIVHYSKLSAGSDVMGQKRQNCDVRAMSALRPIATGSPNRHGRAPWLVHTKLD